MGVWELVEIRERTGSGSFAPPPDFGPDPAGRLVYTESGHVSVNFMRKNRPVWRTEDAPADSERANAATGYGAYSGRYTVEEGHGMVVHHVEVALIPNRVGRELKRHFSFDGDGLLTLRPPPFLRSDGAEVERELVWKRIG